MMLYCYSYNNKLLIIIITVNNTCQTSFILSKVSSSTGQGGKDNITTSTEGRHNSAKPVTLMEQLSNCLVWLVRTHLY